MPAELWVSEGVEALYWYLISMIGCGRGLSWCGAGRIARENSGKGLCHWNCSPGEGVSLE